MGFRQLWNEGQEHAMELKLADNPTIEIVSEKAFLDALEKTNADALETLSEKQEEYKRIWSTARSVGRDFHGLTDGQKKAFDLVKEGKNVYLTGLAGTGKSYIVERIIEWAQTSGLNVITCAPTGIAALNVGGSTVHRVLCIRPGRTLEKDPHPFVPTDSPLPDCDLLILDEVSMCRMDLFDYLSAVLKIAGKIRKQKGKGLCQLLVVGDFCQLPPVITNEERRFLEEKYGYDVGEAFAFQSSEWAFWNFEEVELCEAIRQRDAHFVAALNACRFGDKNGARWIEQHALVNPLPDSIILCSTNAQARDENMQRLNALKDEEMTFVAHVTGEVLKSDMPTDEELSLKPGARVMALVNNSEDTFMNGALGTVINCDGPGALVRFDGIEATFVQSFEWKITKPVLINGRIEKEVVGTFEQIPLKLAWAITIHKSQGQTFDRAIIYPDCWDFGQLYTALSRLTGIHGLYLAHHINDNFLVTSKEVLDFLNGKRKTDDGRRAMMADHSKEKAEWLRKVRDEIRPAYARLLSSGRLILQCDDGSEVAIRFTKGVLPIYVGLNTTWTSIRDVVPGSRISMTTSYEGILRRSAWTTPIDIATGTRHTKSGGVIQNQNWI